MNSVQIPLAERSYEMHIGCGLMDQLQQRVAEITSTQRAMYVVDTNVVDQIQKFIEVDDETCSMMTLFASESNKTMESVERIWSAMLDAGYDRSTPIVAIGGGIVGDVAGFAAASYMRGVPLIQVPTTLLAMVDASIGGKTGVNLKRTRSDGSEVLGKNLAGAFWQPRAVFADVATLDTLDKRQLRCGLAECVKHAMLGNCALLSFLEEHARAILDCDQRVLHELVFLSASIKAEVVAADEREGSVRAFLNLGHTFAHALEPMPELELLHGEAVSIGLVAASRCAETLGMVTKDYVEKTTEILGSLGLPTKLKGGVRVSDLLMMMQLDKKNIEGRLRLVLPEGDTGATIREDVEQEVVARVLHSIGAV
ncbi:MAG: 3-dehydroquinate synthase [Phycisphaerales bacterium]|nr:3-dehydroquinate synthase [Phycisphaerales bacterium]